MLWGYRRPWVALADAIDGGSESLIKRYDLLG
jgi:hypothetical protein